MRVADDIGAHYRSFDKLIGRKTRHLFDPDKLLREVSAGIKDLLREVPVPSVVIGGRPGSTLKRFAAPHVGKPCLLKLDIRNFYPSVSHTRIYRLFTDELGCSPDVARVLTRLTSAEGQLPQGFKTSTDIGNLLIRGLATRLDGLARQHDSDLTVWIDNVVLSGPHHLAQLRPLAVDIFRQEGFACSEADVVPCTQRQTICGVTVNTTLSSDRSKLEQTRSTVQCIAEGNMCAVCDGDASKLRSQLVGRINHFRRISPRQGSRLAHQLRSARISWSCRCR